MKPSARQFRHPSHQQFGYTLLEILVVLGLLGLLTVMAVPGFQDAIQRNSLEGAQRELLSALGLARSEAITRGRVVSICRSVDQSDCAGSSGADWDQGWIVFTDAGTAGSVDGDDALVQVRSQGNAQLAITLLTQANAGFGGDFLQFDEEGFLANSSSGAWFRFCDRDAVQLNARALYLANTGRTAMSVAQPDGIHHDLAGADLTCP